MILFAKCKLVSLHQGVLPNKHMFFDSQTDIVEEDFTNPGFDAEWYNYYVLF